MPPKSKFDRSNAMEAADFIRRRMETAPQVAILTGTGLGEITTSMQIRNAIDYQQIPFFPASTVQTHQGRLLAAFQADHELVVLQGRHHLYEGYSSRAVTFPIRVLQALGVKVLIQTNASGALNPGYQVGEIMIIDDHINLSGDNPLIGPNDDQWGPRFPDMTNVYDARLSSLCRKTASRLGIVTRSGVYAGLKGPSLETPAEMRFLRAIGADAVGFSTVMESIVAVHAGMRVLGLSVVTNLGLPDERTPASVEAIIAAAKAAAPKIEAVVCEIVKCMDNDLIL